MEFMAETLQAFWGEIKVLYNAYLMLLGMGIGVFCYFVDGNNYKRKGLKKETIAAKVTGAIVFASSAGLYILVRIF
jgi:hypothetical protein